MKKRGSLRKKFVICFLVISLVPLFFIEYTAIRKTQIILQQNMKIASLQTLKEVENGFSNYLLSMRGQLKMMSNNQDILDAQYPENREQSIPYIQELLYSVNNSSDEIMNVYYGSEYGELVLIDSTRSEEVFNYKEREWYVQAIAGNGNIIYTNPYEDSETGDMVVTLAQAIKYDGKVIGVFGIDVNISNLQKYINSINILDTGYVLLSDNNGKLIGYNEQNTVDEEVIYKAVEYTDNEKIYECVVDKKNTYISTEINDQTGWHMIGVISEEEIKDDVASIRRIITLVGLIGSIIVIFLAYGISIRLTDKIKLLGQFVGKTSKGDFTSKIVINTNDEIEQLADDFNLMVENIKRLLINIDHTSKNILDTSNNIYSISETTKYSLDEVTNAIGDVADGASNQANNTKKATESVDELSARIENVAKYTDNMGNLSSETEILSESGLEILKTLITKAEKTKENSIVSADIVKEMADSIDKIDLMSNAIASITEQTNLLALNASIEAARAGDMGKGFAVVAEEIRKLAEQSKKSTDDIRQVVDDIIKKAKSAENSMVESINILDEQNQAVIKTEQVFKNILNSVDKLTDGVKHIQDLNNNMEDDKEIVKIQMEDISKVSEETAAVSEEVTASAEEVNASMNELVDYSNNFKEIVNKLNDEMKQFILEKEE